MTLWRKRFLVSVKERRNVYIRSWEVVRARHKVFAGGIQAVLGSIPNVADPMEEWVSYLSHG